MTRDDARGRHLPARRSPAFNTLRKKPLANLEADLGLLQLAELLAHQPGPTQLFHSKPVDPALRIVIAAREARRFVRPNEAFAALPEQL